MTDWKRSSNRTKAAVFDFYGIPHNIKPGKARKPSGEPDEAGVINSVSDLLAFHPRVILAVRQNGGAFTYDTKDGRSAPVWMYKILRGREYLMQQTTVTDFWGLIQGAAGGCVPFALEAKRPGWTFHFSDERAKKQKAFIEMVKKAGGIGGFVTSADEANALLA